MTNDPTIATLKTEPILCADCHNAEPTRRFGPQVVCEECARDRMRGTDAICANCDKLDELDVYRVLDGQPLCRDCHNTTLTEDGGPLTQIPDPHAVPYPEGPLWDRLGHELVYGHGPEVVAREYGEDIPEVTRLSELFWAGYARSMWLEEAQEEHGLILDEVILLPNDELHARLVAERTRHEKGFLTPTETRCFVDLDLFDAYTP